MVAENPTWGAPRIHGELLMLGFDVSERTISRWMKRVPRDPGPGKRWLAFLRNHREVIAAMDFFTVPTITFGVLYGFFVMSHDRRPIVQRDEASDELVDSAAVAGRVSVRVGPLVSDLRSRWEVRIRGSRGGSILKDKTRPNVVRKSMAERNRRAMGRELPEGLAGSYHRGERAPSEAAALGIRQLLS